MRGVALLYIRVCGRGPLAVENGTRKSKGTAYQRVSGGRLRGVTVSDSYVFSGSFRFLLKPAQWFEVRLWPIYARMLSNTHDLYRLVTIVDFLPKCRHCGLQRWTDVSTSWFIFVSFTCAFLAQKWRRRIPPIEDQPNPALNNRA